MIKKFNGAYAVLIKIDQNHITFNHKELKFIPGITVIADVITSKRRLISYFFEAHNKNFRTISKGKIMGVNENS
ncbi:hypothetical protein [Bartonella henselae]|uniref:hypothetical protein n=1 Tax=Bartonella henselae TaxID=38323 RepID=UPI0004BAD678|nr:hypothetical protein [Bartonella henselae]MDM9984038.1 hypothetical protein [Bartonella henselae]MDM9985521.1 hypothetical protein [Bartonella henselae]MDM9987037.1 hypothetical protein [Bartonella henselae]MDM9988494.1 hypothetical protein [Bartonella henselae]MDM9989962.1 hypothetical protein [Bartonella henselae]